MKVRTLALAALAGMIMIGGNAFAQTKPAKAPATTAASTTTAKHKMHKHRAHKVRAAKKDDAGK